MDVLKFLCLALSTLMLPGCYFSYIVESGYNQAKLLTQGEDFETVYRSSETPEETKRKLKLIEETKAFAQKQLNLSKDNNYTKFVQLDRPYVSYVVSAAQKNRLIAKTWSFPIVGEVPYKGFFSEADAKQEATLLANQGLDVFVRGVTAYSTLGYFRDPVLSSMLADEDHEIVSLIIHETVHSTVWIKDQANFNERLAVFLGNKGAIEFYKSKEGSASKTAIRIEQENLDEAIFSKFITQEIADIKTWYADHPTASEEARQTRLQLIRERFTSDVARQMKTDSYSKFASRPLNNAHLVMYDTYFGSLLAFDNLWKENSSDFRLVLDKIKTLATSEDPVRALFPEVKPKE